jgi:26S proteasome regulatory subunit N10
MTAVKVAQLSLKHRMNKNQKSRVVIFCGHPLEEELDEFEKLGKRLRQNNVAIDVINFANPENVPKLQALVESCNKGDNSHFLDVPLGVSMITDVLFTSPILQSEDYGAMGAGAADGTNGMVNDVVGGGAGAPGGMAGFGADFENDPELAQALMISMQEQRAKQNEETGKPEEGEAPVADAPMNDGGDDSHDEDYYI